MKKLFILFVTFLAVAHCFSQINQVKVVKQPAGAGLLKFKGNVPFFVKSSSTVKNIVAVSATNPSFKMQRGTKPVTKNVTSEVVSDQPNEQGRYCTESVVSADKGDYEKIVLGNQNDKIYPGAIYYENAFIDGTYNAPGDLQLKPYDINTDLFSATFSGSTIVNVQPNMGAVSDGIGTLMRRSERVKNASNVAISVESISTAEELAFEVGANFTGYGVDMTADFNYMKSTKKSVFIAKLTQVYFSIRLNRADGRSLVDNPSLGSNLVYISKVNYGRMGYIMIASDSSQEAIAAALNVQYNSGSVGGGVSASLRYQKLMSTLQVKGFFFGGDAANTMSITSPDQLKSFDDYVQNGMRLDPAVAPVAVSYTLQYLNDNAIAATRVTTTYTDRVCVPAKGIRLQFHNVAIEDVHSGDCSYAWGNIAVEVWETNAQKTPIKMLWSGAFWNYNAGAPNRTVINHADIRAGNNIRPEVRDIPNGVRNIAINPRLATENRVMLRFKIEINTRHKDNDFAALGEHGMKRVEVVDKMLNEVFVPSDMIQARPGNYKYGTFTAGRFCSNTDRVHCFYALFTITND